ncbi:MAG: HAD family hydrolase [Lachnospiraceae bacterium]|nr:HAD family hydrolase [Lachnospiraceae bacterium]
MALKAVLFDLDGTLLPMDQENFMKLYFGGLAKKLTPYGYEPQKLIDSIWAGTAAMVKNDGSRTNEDTFWDIFEKSYGRPCRQDEPIFDSFYRNEFIAAKDACGFVPEAKEAVDFLKENGVTVILATNPLFPPIATENRMAWAGLSPEDFSLYTTYDNSSYCKPNPKYYAEILQKINLNAEDCLMVGNDVAEDMVAETLGMKVFLLTDCLLNTKNLDITKYPQGGFTELNAYLRSLL